MSYITVKFYYEKYIIHKSDKHGELLDTKMLSYTVIQKINYFDVLRLTTNIIYENII